MQKIRVFLNQQASKCAERDWQKIIRERLFRSDLEFVNPNDHGAFLAEIDRAMEDQIDVIISVGGDGTIHALIQKLADRNMSFLVIPAGTANDFARSLGVHSMMINELLSVVRIDNPRVIDLIDINGVLMATNGGLGVVAEIASRVNLFRHTVPGFRKLMSYAKDEIYTMMLGSKLIFEQCIFNEIRIDCDAYRGIIRTPLFLINNQPLLAANYPVAPMTKHDDGTFNVTVFLHQNTTDFIAAVIRIRQGVAPENDPLILSFETTALILETMGNKNLEFMGDGEILVSAKRFEISIRPKALKVFAETVKQIRPAVRPRKLRLLKSSKDAKAVRPGTNSYMQK